MGRLIDADALIENMRNRKYIDKALCEIFETVVDEQPTAYDVEAKVAELEKRADDNDRCADRLSGIEGKKKIREWRARAQAFRDSAEIVRGKE